MRRLSITLFSLCLASALTAQVTGSNQSVRLRADNIDEVVSAMTLEEKVHLVIGCGMSMGSDTKFPGTAGRTYDIPRLGIPSAYLADGPHRLAMAAKREFDSRTYHATEFPSSNFQSGCSPQGGTYFGYGGEGLWFGCVAGTGCQPDAKCALRT